MERIKGFAMIAFIRQILGAYTAITYQVYNEASQAVEDIIPAGLAGVDWGYIITGLAFLILLYSALKLIGALICKIF